MRILRWVFVLIGLVIAVGAAAWFVIPKDKIAEQAITRIEAQIGRDITIAGGVDLGLFPNLSVRAGDITIANADWAEQGAMVTARELRVGVALIPALSGNIEITELQLDTPQIVLEVARDGRQNWVFDTTPADGTAQSQNAQTGDTASSTGAPAAAQSIALPLAKLTDGTVRYIDYAAGSDTTVADINVTIKMPAMDRAAQVSGAITLADGPITFDATLTTPAAVMAGDMAALTVTAAAKGGDVSFVGDIATAPAARGTIKLGLTDTRAFAGAFGIALSGLQPNLGASIKGGAAIDMAENRIALSDLAVGLGQNTIAGKVTVALGDVPSISGSVNVGTFDLRSGAAAASGEGTSVGTSGGDQQSGGWSTAKIDASALHSVNATVAYTADAVLTDTVKTGAVRGDITLDAGRMVVGLDSLAAYNGAATGQFVVNARKGLSMAAKVTGTDFNVQGLFTDLMDMDKVQGSANFQIDLLAAGSSVDALMKSLSGQGTLGMVSGRWTGVDLDKVLRSGQVEKGTTVFDDMGASFAIANGVLDNRDLKFSLPNFETTGAGQIDLGARTIDYTISPKATKVRDGQGVSVPLKIKGSWDSPKLTADVQAAIDQNLAKEKAELEAKAKEKIDAEKKKLEQKAQEKLGITVQEGQSVEDALKQKLQDEAAKGLLNLLGK